MHVPLSNFCRIFHFLQERDRFPFGCYAVLLVFGHKLNTRATVIKLYEVQSKVIPYRRVFSR